MAGNIRHMLHYQQMGFNDMCLALSSPEPSLGREGRFALDACP